MSNSSGVLGHDGTRDKSLMHCVARDACGALSPGSAGLGRVSDAMMFSADLQKFIYHLSSSISIALPTCLLYDPDARSSIHPLEDVCILCLPAVHAGSLVPSPSHQFTPTDRKAHKRGSTQQAHTESSKSSSIIFFLAAGPCATTDWTT